MRNAHWVFVLTSRLRSVCCGADLVERINEEHFQHCEQHLSVVSENSHTLLGAFSERALHSGHSHGVDEIARQTERNDFRSFPDRPAK